MTDLAKVRYLRCKNVTGQLPHGGWTRLGKAQGLSVSGHRQVLDLCREDFKTQMQAKVRVRILKLWTVRQKKGPWR